MVWTLYGAGVCLLITVAWFLLRWISGLFSDRRKIATTIENAEPGEGDAR